MLRDTGVEALHLREKDLDDRDLYDLTVRTRRTFPLPGLLLVNRRLDIALAAGASGVHLPAEGLPTGEVRRRAPSGFLVGRSTHTLNEVETAAREGADYVVFGPVFDTPSKTGRIEPRGLSALSRASAQGVPVLAIGGIDPGNAAVVMRAGACGVAAMRAFFDAASAARMVAAVGDGALPE